MRNFHCAGCDLHPSYLGLASYYDIVACKPVAGQRQRTKQKYNSRYWVTAWQKSIFARQQLETATEEWSFLCGPCRDVISRTGGAMSYL
jgi:hypothetical protein